MYSIPILRAGLTIDIIDCIMKNRREKIKKSNIVDFPYLKCNFEIRNYQEILHCR